jgi:O-antigen ligase
MALALERATAAALAATVFGFACGSTIFNGVLVYGRPLRWACLGMLVALALAYALAARPLRLPVPFLYATGALVAVAFASSLWSVDASLTVRRSGAFALLVAAGVGVLYGSRGRADSVRRLLLGLLAGMAAVALAGLVALAVSYDQAVQPATLEYPARFRGFAQNPNTASLLLGVGTPLAVLFALDARSLSRRAAALGAVALFAGSIAASGSRGAMLGALAGTLVLVFGYGGARRRRLVLAVAALGVFGVCVGLSQIPQPTSPPPTEGVRGGVKVQVARRTLFTSSGRKDAWRGAIRQAAERPLAGYGFGTEELAFVNRYPGFYSDLPENSFIGAALQLGLAGLVLFLAAAVASLAAAVRLFRRPSSPTRTVAAACAGAAVSALVLGVTESYLFAVGNIATTSAWLCMFLLVALSERSA